MKRRSEPRSGYAWLVAVLMTATPLLLALCREMWVTPYPISETVSLLQMAGVMGEPSASSGSWIDPTLRSFFQQVTHDDPDRRKIAIVATAHRLCRIMAAMLRTGETWRQ